uniref:hypothetical protein n=1 Tax=Eubacterium cellulosolvens TaxID=29322 RepID=UPI000483A1EF|nr:hypothetical protein [[Eubacterium] cellulosolvens]
MKTINIANGPQNVSAIIQGCMRMPGLMKEAADLHQSGAASDVNLSHHDWYALYLAAGKYLP